MKKRSIWDSFNFRTKMYFFFRKSCIYFLRQQKSGRNHFVRETKARETNRGEIWFTVTSDCRKISVPFNFWNISGENKIARCKLNGTVIFLQSDVTVNRISPRFVSPAFVSCANWFLPDFCGLYSLGKTKLSFCSKICAILNYWSQ